MTKSAEFLSNKEKRAELLNELGLVLRYSKGFGKYTAVYVVLGIAGIILGFISGLASKFLVDAVTGKDRNTLVTALCAFAGAGVFSILFSAFSQRLVAKINTDITNSLRGRIFSGVLESRWEEISVFPAGDIINRMSGDVSAVVKCITEVFPGVITRGFRFIGSFFIIFYYDRIMALIALLSAPVIVLSSRALLTKMREYNKRSKEIGSEVMSFTEESVRSLSFIKSFALTGLFSERYSALQNRQRETILDFNRFSVTVSIVMGITGLAAGFLSYGWGVYRLWTGAITYGTMVLFIQMASGLTGSFSSLVALIPEAVSAATGAGRLNELLSAEKEDETGVCSEFEGTPGILFENVDFSYKNGGKVFDGACFELNPGETAAVTGESGSGKTTLLRLMTALIYPSKGSIFLTDGERKIPLEARHRKLFACVSQENVLISGTVKDNLLAVNPSATDEEIISALKTACADFVFTLPQGINTYLSRGEGLSQGQKQRISIARALVSDRKIILFDEATAALDEENERKIMQNIFSSEKKRTCVFATHRQSVLGSADKVYNIENGRLTEV